MRPIRALSDHRLKIALLLTALAAAPCVAAADGPDSSSNSAGKMPPFSTVKSTVERSLATDRSYRTGDLLSQRQVAAVLGEIKKAGWDVEQDRKLLARVPADNEFIVRALRSSEGTAFMRKVSAMPDGYDRVDRLSRIPNGQQTLQKLIAGPDGHRLIGYLTEARGGKEMGTMLGRTPQGVNFNEPTGRIYTAAQLLVELESLHAAAAKQAMK
jgi:hypothetical protein